ncbi:MAG: hypothetical protein OH316_02620 [Candidatus Parvarchaeota archaeon]|nr:hypothetical protein [Candidatus Parvarchaeota archaeon]MCW1302004.1 hypothetical protein [Candidatus Parvarchaeota archaeon]
MIWNLSEILVEPIDEDPELKKLVPKTAPAYREYYKIRVNAGTESLMEHFKKIYAEEKADFSGLLKKSYVELKRLEIFKG